MRCLCYTILSLFCGQALIGTDFHLYYLGGQSNMDGYGTVSELPEGIAEAVNDVYIFHGNMGEDGKPLAGQGKWSVLQPGHGRSFSSDGEINRYSDRFGLELTFAKRMKELYPDRRIAIIKYSRGGTSIDPEASAASQFGCWDPEWTGGEGEGKGVNQYDHFQQTLRNAKQDTDIDDDGSEDRLIPAGILWMQGESDAMEPHVAEDYEENLTELMNRIRADLGDPDLRVAIGRITDWKVWVYHPVVRKAQQEFVEKDSNAALVTSTDKYGKSDQWHYDTAGYLDLGVQFADTFVKSAE